MFESAEIGRRVSKEDYSDRVPALRGAVLAGQYKLLAAGTRPVLVLVAGVEGAGKGDTVNLLQSWLDPRHVRVYGFGAPTDEERERPPFWRFWRVLPPKGTIGVFMGSWYTQPILDRTEKRTKDAQLDTAMEHIRQFERMLTDEGVVLLKLWFHLSKDEQRARLERLEADPKTRWRVTKHDWAHFDLYDRFRGVSAHALRETSTDNAPWLVVAGRDRRYRELAVGEALVAAMGQATIPRTAPDTSFVMPSPPSVDDKTILDVLDLSRTLEKEEYESRLEELQGRMHRLTRRKRFQKDHAIVAVFEGTDAAGKGGAIRRLTAALDARTYHVVPIAAPTEEERRQPYLWRFWRHLPARGRLAVFDRSWYGRVLVERVEGFAAAADWHRAYSEINEFEEQLSNHGIVVVKLWLQIDPQEQLRRFKERESTEFKKHKLTSEDWRNREKWNAYRVAVADMISRTSTGLAPWTLVEANDKRYARVKVLETLVDAVERA